MDRCNRVSFWQSPLCSQAPNRVRLEVSSRNSPRAPFLLVRSRVLPRHWFSHSSLVISHWFLHRKMHVLHLILTFSGGTQLQRYWTCLFVFCWLLPAWPLACALVCGGRFVLLNGLLSNIFHVHRYLVLVLIVHLHSPSAFASSVVQHSPCLETRNILETNQYRSVSPWLWLSLPCPAAVPGPWPCLPCCCPL
jgi:hypothetical protein